MRDTEQSQATDGTDAFRVEAGAGLPPGWRIELGDTTRTLLVEIGDKRFTQKDVALTYSLARRSSEPTDWPTVNRAIMDRWNGRASIIRVKRLVERIERGDETALPRISRMMRDLEREAAQ